MPTTMGKAKIIVVGAGPAGALCAIYAATRGYNVEVYELRGDLRDPKTTLLNFTRSINLAISERGLNSIKLAHRPGLVESILEESIPMHGRMIHGVKNDTFYHEAQDYDALGRSIRAADRGSLNKRLLDDLEKMPNVKIFFGHKLTGADFDRKKAWFEQQMMFADSRGRRLSSAEKRAAEVERSFDLMIGADGAHSAVRFHLMKFARMSYSQDYIDTLWCEFHMTPTEAQTQHGGYRISPHHLHIWPGKDFMFIAIPSQDKSFTCTLFMPASGYERLDANPDELVSFFQENFPGVVPSLIPPQELKQQYLQNPHLPLISIKCSPYHYSSTVVILGDAAHAMVPFYGQGMNAGLEDVRVLFDIFDKHASSLDADSSTTLEQAREAALAEYTRHRRPDAFAINDLALRNYQEMRSDVQSRFYLLRKRLEEILSVYLPSLDVATQYSRISFGNDRYSDVETAVQRQKKIFAWFMGSVSTGVLGALGYGLYWVASKPRVLQSWTSWWAQWRR